MVFILHRLRVSMNQFKSSHQSSVRSHYWFCCFGETNTNHRQMPSHCSVSFSLCLLTFKMKTGLEGVLGRATVRREMESFLKARCWWHRDPSTKEDDAGGSCVWVQLEPHGEYLTKNTKAKQKISSTKLLSSLLSEATSLKLRFKHSTDAVHERNKKSLTVQIYAL